MYVESFNKIRKMIPRMSDHDFIQLEKLFVAAEIEIKDWERQELVEFIRREMNNVDCQPCRSVEHKVEKKAKLYFGNQLVKRLQGRMGIGS